MPTFFFPHLNNKKRINILRKATLLKLNATNLLVDRNQRDATWLPQVILQLNR